jgi:hypothetical protein
MRQERLDGGTVQLSEAFRDVEAADMASRQLAATLARSPALTLSRQMTAATVAARFPPVTLNGQLTATLAVWPSVPISKQLTGNMMRLAAPGLLNQQLIGNMTQLATTLARSPALTLSKQLTESIIQLAELAALLQADGVVPDVKAGHLSPPQERLLCGYFAYAVIWLIVLQLMLIMLGSDDSLGRITDLLAGMTGISGHKIASIARDLAYKVYDQLQRP